MLYNETIATTTNFTSDGVMIGFTVCQTSLPLELLVLLFTMGLFFLVVFAFKHKRK